MLRFVLILWLILLTCVPHGSSDMIAETETLLKRPSAWQELSKEEIVKHLYLACRLYGVRNDPSMVSSLAAFYRLARTRSALPERMQVLEAVDRAIEDGLTSVNALLPFIFAETETALVGTAVLSLALLGSAVGGD